MGDGNSDADSGKFLAADADAELNPGENKDFKVDPSSNDISTCKQNRGGGEPPKKNSTQTLKTTMLVSALMGALAAVVIVLTKKLKEK